MPAVSHTGAPPGPVPAAPGLDLIEVFRFTAADSTTGPHEKGLFDTQTTAIHGPLDPSWQTGKPFVTYHDMAQRVFDSLDLSGVDLVVVVDATPDCRHQSLPACLLSYLMGTDPLIVGITDQGPTAPFTALRVAYDRVRSGSAGKALVLVLEQSTLPPEDDSPAPVGDTAVALLLTAGGALPISRPQVARDAGAWTGGLSAQPGYGCAGPWVALAEHLPAAEWGGVLVTCQDERYSAGIVVTVPAPAAALATTPAAATASPGATALAAATPAAATASPGAVALAAAAAPVPAPVTVRASAEAAVSGRSQAPASGSVPAPAPAHSRELELTR